MKAVLLVLVAWFIACASPERIIQASELPTDSIVTESKIQEIQKIIENGTVIIKGVYHLLFSLCIIFYTLLQINCLLNIQNLANSA